MDNRGTINASFTFIVLLALSIVLLVINIIEMINLKKNWNLAITLNKSLFEEFLREDFLVKIVFSAFALIATISITIVLIFLLLFYNFFLEKILYSYLYINYLIFGLYMLGFCIYGFVIWKKVVYIYDVNNPEVRMFSIGNCFTIIGCFLMSLLITLGFSLYEIMNLYIDSIHKKDNGSILLRKLFWYLVGNRRSEVNNQRNNENDDDNNENAEDSSYLNNNNNAMVQNELNNENDIQNNNENNLIH